MKRLLVLTGLLIFTACAATESPTPTRLPSPTSTATVTVTPCPTLTVAETQVPVEIQYVPETQYVPPSVAEMLRSDPFFATNQPGCELPCWFGLQIGKSTLEDVKQVYEVDFRTQWPLVITVDKYIHDESIITIHYPWYTLDTDVPESTDIAIITAMDKQTETLLGVQIVGVASDFDDVTYGSPLAHVLEILGLPDRIMFQNLSYAVNIYLTYYSGFHFEYEYHFYDEPPVIVEELETTTLCFDENPFFYAQTIVSPLDGVTINTADPVQREWYFEPLSLLESDAYAPFAEDVHGLLNLTPQELTELVVSGEQVCFEIDFSRF